MRDVLISIKPRWCELIASGKKTVEVRRTRPKCETPFKCYIYCTKDNTFAEKTLRGFDDNGKALYYKANKGKVIGEFVCDKIYDITPHFDTPTFPNQYICGWDYGKEFDCLSFEELTSYLNGKKGYGWHISDLVVYDEPRELSDFLLYNVRTYIDEESGLPMPTHEIARPFQSWGYVEATEPRQTAD